MVGRRPENAGERTGRDGRCRKLNQLGPPKQERFSEPFLGAVLFNGAFIFDTVFATL